MEYYRAIKIRISCNLRQHGWTLKVLCSNTFPEGIIIIPPWNKSGRRRKIPYDLNYMWNLKQNKTKVYRYREQIDDCLRWGWRVGGMDERGQKL